MRRLSLLGLGSLLLLTCASGCSFMFVHGAPEGHAKMQYFDCVSSAGAPLADVAVATLGGLITIAMIDDDDVSASGPITFGGLATLHAASAIYGFANGASCGAAKQQLADRISTTEAERIRQLQALDEQIKAQSSGCSSDTDCKGDRICTQAQCV